MTVHTNSLFHYEQKIRPELNDRQKAVLYALRSIGGGTMHQVADYMEEDLNRISGRFGEIEKKGWIKGEKGPNNRTIWKSV